MRRLIATGGKAGSGKDHILDMLLAYEAGQEGRTVKSGFGDLIRMELGITDPKQDRARQQAHGLLRRAQDENYWTKKAVEWGHEGLAKGLDVVGIAGVRFLNEIEILRAGGFYLVLVEAPEEVRKRRLFERDGRWWTDAELNHHTETALDEIPRKAWDAVIRNG